MPIQCLSFLSTCFRILCHRHHYFITLIYIDTFVCLRAFILLFQLAVGGGGAVLVLSELESMAARQQREIAQQRRLLEQKEARLAVLRGAQVGPILFLSTRENHFIAKALILRIKFENNIHGSFEERNADLRAYICLVNSTNSF